jgi:methionine synthase II (cobalamin-independent)
MSDLSPIPFRFDMVGSLLRSDALKKARDDLKNELLTKEKYQEIQKEEIIKLVQKEVEIGLKAVTDGEYPRSWWHLDFLWGLEGIEKVILQQGRAFHSS